MLQYLLKEEVEKCLQLKNKLEIAKIERSSIAKELAFTKLERSSTHSSMEQVWASAQDFSKSAATDRKWLEAEMSKRAAVTKALKTKSETELARMKRKFSKYW